MTPAEFVEEMSTVITERGWTQGTFADEEGVCILGARNVVYTYRRPQTTTMFSAVAAIAQTILGDGHLIPGYNDFQKEATSNAIIALYNDKPSTSLEDVQLILKHTIERLNNT